MNTVTFVAVFNDSKKMENDIKEKMDKIDLNFVRKVSVNETYSASNSFNANFSHFIKNLIR